MPHVDELLGITTLASMGLLVAVSLQPVEGTGSATTAPAERPVVATTKAVSATPVAFDKPAARSVTTAKERT